MEGRAADFLEKRSMAKHCWKRFAAPPNVVATKISRAEIEDLRGRCDLLTPRELQVFELIVAGLLNEQGAAELGTSEQTIKFTEPA
jgi:FixJ family two-component response regulator